MSNKFGKKLDKLDKKSRKQAKFDKKFNKKQEKSDTGSLGKKKKIGSNIANKGKLGILNIVKITGRGIFDIGIHCINAIKKTILLVIGFSWIFWAMFFTICLWFWLVPALKQYTLDSLNTEGDGETTGLQITKENKAIENYYKYHTDKALDKYKIQIKYKNINESLTGRELFLELQKEETKYIEGPILPNKLTTPKQQGGVSTNTNAITTANNYEYYEQQNNNYYMKNISEIKNEIWNNEKSLNDKTNTIIKQANLTNLDRNKKIKQSEIEKSQVLIYDIETSTTFFVVRTGGENYFKVEYATIGDMERMESVLIQDFKSENPRGVFIINNDIAYLGSWIPLNIGGLEELKAGDILPETFDEKYIGKANHDYIANGTSGYMKIILENSIENTNEKYYEIENSKILEYWNKSTSKSLIEIYKANLENNSITIDSINKSKWGGNNLGKNKQDEMKIVKRNNQSNETSEKKTIIKNETVSKSKNMEGFLSEKSIDTLISKWKKDGVLKGDISWQDSQLKNELNTKINYGYKINSPDNLDLSKFDINRDLSSEQKNNLFDKYGREEFFKLSPELLHSLNKYVFDDKYIHAETFTKPVKINEDTLQLDITGLGSIGEDRFEYGLGTVFVYKPIITFAIERGVEVKQDGLTIAHGNIFNNVDCKIEYVLDRAITFEGEYIFTYEQSVRTIEENNSDKTNYNSTNGVKDTLIQKKVYEVTEAPKDIIFQNKGRMYINEYLGSFRASIPEDVVEGFNRNKIYDTFQNYEKGFVKTTITKEVTMENINSSTNSSTATGSSSGTVSISNGDAPRVERWRSICEEVGNNWGIDPNILLALIDNESSGNPHVGNANYKGLGAMGANNWKEYFKSNEIWYSYTHLDRIPKCNNDGHSPSDCSECQRVGRFQIEYLARRFSAQMNMYLNDFCNKNSTKDELTQEEIKMAIFFSFCAYNSGEYGQFALYEQYKESLYEYPGDRYKEIYETVKNISPSKYFGGKTYTPINPKANSAYLKKGYIDFKLYAPYELNESAEKFNYNPKLWHGHATTSKSNTMSSTTISTIFNIPKRVEAILSKTKIIKKEEAGLEENNKCNPILVEQYEKYEKEGWNKKMKIVSQSLDENEIELILENSNAMKRQVSLSEVKNGSYSFWDENYIENNFNNGLPKGQNYENYENKSIDPNSWNKIIQVCQYIDSNMGKNQIRNLNPFNSSNFIGHAYNTITGISLPRNPLGLIRMNTNSIKIEDITLGDVVILSTNSSTTIGTGQEASDSAIYIGEGTYCMIEGGKITSVPENILEENYKILKIIRPIESSSDIIIERTSSQNSLKSTQQGEYIWPTTEKKLGSKFGMRFHPIHKIWRPHTGIDISRLDKSVQDPPIYAVKRGIVIQSGVRGGYGNLVEIDHGNGITSRYAHAKTNLVKVGDVVEQGQLIQIMGTTGGSTGIHLHFEIRKNGQAVDPVPYLNIPDDVQGK